MLKRILIATLVIILLIVNPTYAKEKTLLETECFCLLEAETGIILASNNEDKKVSPASITKIMTLLIACEKIDEKKLSLTDIVTTSAYAKSMGGSQVFLEEGETQTVEDILKSIVIASGNDASVALAEHICGSEEQFVKVMNEKAKELKMNNTNFTDCCGLTDSDEHYTSAKDVAIMSKELITKHPYILNYSSVWMDKIIHNTKKGTKEFVLSNTNKLLKINSNVLGLKTGSTTKAGYCVSAYAKEGNLNLISVVMGADNNKKRFEEANKLIKYGSSNFKKYQHEKITGKMKVYGGEKDEIDYTEETEFCYLLDTDEDINNIEHELVITKQKAPIQKRETVGEVIYKYKGKVIKKNKLLAQNSVEKTNIRYCLKKISKALLPYTS